MNSKTHDAAFPRILLCTLAVLVACLCVGAFAALQPNQAYAAAPAKVKVSKVTSPAAGQVYVTVKKAKRAKGYQFMVSTKKKFEKAASYSIKTVKVKKKTFATIGGLEEGVTYYVKVRAFKGKKYGKWSKVKSVRVLTGADEAAAAIAQANADVQKYKTDAEESARNLVSATTLLSETQGKNEQLQADLDDAISAKTTADLKAAEANKALVEAKFDLTSANQKVEKLDSQLRGAEAANTELAKTNKELQDANTGLKQDKEKAENAAEKAESNLKAEQETTKALSGQVEELKNELAGTGTVIELSSNAAKLGETKSALDVKLLALQKKVKDDAALKAKWDAIAAKYDAVQMELSSALESVEAAVADAGDDAADTKASAKLEARISALQATAEAIAAECDALETEADNAAAIASGKTAQEKLTSKVEELQGKVDELSAELKGSGVTVSTLSANAGASATTLNGDKASDKPSLEERIASIKESFDKAKNDGVLASEEQAAISGQLAELDKQLETAKANLEAAQDALKNATGTEANAKLEAQITALTASIASLDAECTALEADLVAKTQSSLVAGLQEQLNEARAMIPATITYDCTGGEFPEGTEPVKMLKTGDTITLPAVVREGAQFAGWHAISKGGASVAADSLSYEGGVVYAISSDSSGEKKVDVTKQTPTGIEVTVYADWRGSGIHYAYLKLEDSDLYELLIGLGGAVPAKGETYTIPGTDKTGTVVWVGEEPNSAYSISGLTTLGSGVGMDLVDLDSIDLSKSTYLDLSGLDVSNETSLAKKFANNTAVETLILDNWDTSKVTDMSDMFYGCANLKEVSIKGWNTSNVTTMEQMFSGCTSLTTVDVSELETGNLVNSSRMFYDCESLESTNDKPLDFSKFDSSKIVDMNNMFWKCTSIETLSLPNFATSNTTNVQGMFSQCGNLVTLDISGWDMSNVKGSKINIASNVNMMFNDCSKLETITAKSTPKGAFKLPVDSSAFFQVLTSLKTIEGIEEWDTSHVESMAALFRKCGNLGAVTASTVTLNLSGWNTAKVTDMNRMFDGCSSLTHMDFVSDSSNFTTSNVTDFSMMFFDCVKLGALTLGSSDGGGFDTSKATNMVNMFSNCPNLSLLKLGPDWVNPSSNSATFGKNMRSTTTGMLYASDTVIPNGSGTYSVA